MLADKRGQISDNRRSFAQASLLTQLYPQLASYRCILSFCSFSHEIDTFSLNYRLASEKRLHLPRINGEQLQLFYVASMEGQLSLSSLNILEPIAELCAQVSSETIDCVLVPALGFDQSKYRIGYGKGYYDRLINAVRQLSTKPYFIGIGFQEQLVEGNLPRQQHDQPLDEVFLF